MYRTSGSLLVLACGFVALSASAAAATTWHVPGDSSGTCTIVSPNCNTIAAAYTASASGDTIQIGAGSFPIASQINLLKQLTIVGAGPASTTITPTTAGFSVRASGIVIRDLRFQGGTTAINFQSVSTSNTEIRNVEFVGQTSRGIDVGTVETAPLSDIRVIDSSFAVANIGMRMASRSRVTGLSFTGTSFTGGVHGIYQANDGNASRLSGLEVSDCTFTNIPSYAIYVEELRDSTIELSTFTSVGVGIQLLKLYNSSGVGAANITIQGNEFTDVGSRAIDLEILNSALETGILVSGNQFDLDVGAATGGGLSAIVVILRDPYTHDPVTVSENLVNFSGTFVTANRAYGLLVRGNGPVIVSGNSFDGGSVGGSATNPPTSGIFLEANAPGGFSGGQMPATASFYVNCNRLTGFVNGVSVWDSVNAVYGGLLAGTTVTLEDNAIEANSGAGIVNGASPTLAAEDNWFGCVAGPGNPGCDTVTGDVDATPWLTAPSTCAPCTVNAECDDEETCTTDTCTGVCENAAGNTGAECRAAAGVCDLAETCDGVSPTCPADAKSTAECRATGGACDVAESCDGVGNDCPADAVATVGTTCRAVAGACDVAETCDGVGIACPADAVAASGTTCRSAAGVCDLEEVCDGAVAACPADAKSTAECRAAVGVCDLAESCDGVGDSCPADAKSTAVCRAAAGDCDVAESCDGAGNFCPADTLSAPSVECRASAGDCDTPENCTGSNPVCPADGFAPNGSSCGASGSCFNGNCGTFVPIVLNKAVLRTNTGTTKPNGRVFAQAVINDNATSGALEAALLGGSIEVVVSDGSSFSATRALENCVLRNDRIRCRSTDRRTTAVFLFRPVGPFLYTVRLSLNRLTGAETGAAAPAGPVSVTFDEGTIQHGDTIGDQNACLLRGGLRLLCREP